MPIWEQNYKINPINHNLLCKTYNSVASVALVGAADVFYWQINHFCKCIIFHIIGTKMKKK